tara:strand:- start:2069 stop:2377 length:309 start_codon:yes stop_codon:yes gene_type:complete
MPLDKQGLYRNLKSALQRQGEKEGEEVRDQQDGIDQWANDVANAIDQFVRSGDVKTAVTTAVTTVNKPGQGVMTDPVSGAGSTITAGKGLGAGAGKGEGKVT